MCLLTTPFPLTPGKALCPTPMAEWMDVKVCHCFSVQEKLTRALYVISSLFQHESHAHTHTLAHARSLAHTHTHTHTHMLRRAHTHTHARARAKTVEVFLLEYISVVGKIIIRHMSESIKSFVHLPRSFTHHWQAGKFISMSLLKQYLQFVELDFPHEMFIHGVCVSLGRFVLLKCDYMVSACWCAGLYCSGWIAQGPVFVILGTMNDGFATGKVVLEDIASGCLPAGSKGGKEHVLSLLEQKGEQHHCIFSVQLLNVFYWVTSFSLFVVAVFVLQIKRDYSSKIVFMF